MIISDTQLQIFVIYENPADFELPGFVVRCWVIDTDGTQQPTMIAVHAPTLDGARSTIPPGLFRLDRSPGDDPCIRESWL